MSTTSAPATAATVGQELVGLCRQGRNGDAIERLYSKDIVSVEPTGSEAMPAETAKAAKKPGDTISPSQSMTSASSGG